MQRMKFRLLNLCQREVLDWNFEDFTVIGVLIEDFNYKLRFKLGINFCRNYLCE